MYCLAWKKEKDTDFGVAKITFLRVVTVGQFTFPGYCDFAGFLLSTKVRKRAKRSMTVGGRGGCAGYRNTHRNTPSQT
jgi:hypothetical protein